MNWHSLLKFFLWKKGKIWARNLHDYKMDNKQALQNIGNQSLVSFRTLLKLLMFLSMQQISKHLSKVTITASLQ